MLETGSSPAIDIDCASFEGSVGRLSGPAPTPSTAGPCQPMREAGHRTSTQPIEQAPDVHLASPPGFPQSRVSCSYVTMELRRQVPIGLRLAGKLRFNQLLPPSIDQRIWILRVRAGLDEDLVRQGPLKRDRLVVWRDVPSAAIRQPQLSSVPSDVT